MWPSQGPVGPASGTVLYLPDKGKELTSLREQWHLADANWVVSSYLSTLHGDNMDVPALFASLQLTIPGITVGSKVPSTLSSRSARNERKRD